MISSCQCTQQQQVYLLHKPYFMLSAGLPQPIFASVTQRMLTISLGNLLDRIADEYARNDAVG